MAIQFLDDLLPEPNDGYINGGDGQGHVQDGKQHLPFEDILIPRNCVSLQFVVRKGGVENVDHLFGIVRRDGKCNLNLF